MNATLFDFYFEFVVVSVKEACLLAMLRVAADCEDIPNTAVEKVHKASEISGRYLRRVCSCHIWRNNLRTLPTAL